MSHVMVGAVDYTGQLDMVHSGFIESPAWFTIVLLEWV